MKQYVCIKEYVTEEGEVAYKLGNVYELEKYNLLTSEISGVKYYFGSNFKKTYFKKYKPFTGNGIWTGNTTEFIKKDSIVESVIKKFQDRSRVGIQKYKTTLDRKDINFDGWAEHLQQELMDGILYLERLKKE